MLWRLALRSLRSIALGNVWGELQKNWFAIMQFQLRRGEFVYDIFPWFITDLVEKDFYLFIFFV